MGFIYEFLYELIKSPDKLIPCETNDYIREYLSDIRGLSLGIE